MVVEKLKEREDARDNKRDEEHNENYTYTTTYWTNKDLAYCIYNYLYSKWFNVKINEFFVNSKWNYDVNVTNYKEKLYELSDIEKEIIKFYMPILFN